MTTCISTTTGYESDGWWCSGRVIALAMTRSAALLRLEQRGELDGSGEVGGGGGGKEGGQVDGIVGAAAKCRVHVTAQHLLNTVAAHHLLPLLTA